jgi:molybdate transport system substrate-binding protein
MNLLQTLLLASLLLLNATARAEKITIAAASDLKAAMDEIAAEFRTANPQHEVDVVYGSSGKFFAQIQQGAPYDAFFSADIAYPQHLVKDGLAISPVIPYAIGRLVLWHASPAPPQLTREFLSDRRISHIAIANPLHAPYGKRAEEALRALGLWEQLQPKLVFGENIAQTAQFVLSGNAQVGMLALSLALSPELAKLGSYTLVSDTLHEPLEQGFVITQRAATSALAKQFVVNMSSANVRRVMRKYGFVLPSEAADAR